MAAPNKQPEQLSKQSIQQLAKIDWEQVGSYISAGVTAVTIAAKLGIDRTTLYNRCQKDNGITYSTFSRQKKSIGIADLQLAAYNAALQGATDARFTGALIFQLKARCGMSDKPKDEKEQNIQIQLVTVPRPTHE